MNKENCALKLVDEIILYYDARSKKHPNKWASLQVIFNDKLLGAAYLLPSEKHLVVISIFTYMKLNREQNR